MILTLNFKYLGWILSETIKMEKEIKKKAIKNEEKEKHGKSKLDRKLKDGRNKSYINNHNGH